MPSTAWMTENVVHTHTFHTRTQHLSSPVVLVCPARTHAPYEPYDQHTGDMLSALTSLYRPAESHTIYPSRAVRSGAPRWCHQLIDAQENGRCISPFTNIPASLRVPLHLHRDA